MGRIGFLKILKNTVVEWKSFPSQMAAAALSFFTLFSLTPFLIIVISLTKYMGTPLPKNRPLLHRIGSLVGGEEGKAVHHWLSDILAKAGPHATFWSVIFLIIGAASVFVNLEKSLLIIWKNEGNDRRTLKHFLQSRLASIVMIIVVIVFIFVFFLADTTLSILSSSMGGWIRSPSFWPVVHYALSTLLLSLLFIMAFKLMSGRALGWKGSCQGGSITAILFTSGRALLRLYFSIRPVGSIYGPAAWAVVIPLWIYFSWQIFLFGAQLTWQYRNRLSD